MSERINSQSVSGRDVKFITDLHRVPRLLLRLYTFMVWIAAKLLSKKKGKAVPLQAWTGPEGSRNLRLPDFVTTAQDGGRKSA